MSSNSRFRSGRLTVLLASLSLTALVLTSAASAVECRQWTRLAEAQRDATVTGEIEKGLTGNVVQQYGVSVSALRRCLMARRTEIAYRWDDACDDKRTAKLGALDEILTSYFWACAPNR